MDYGKMNALGRLNAAQAIQEYQQTDNLPQLVRHIRDAAGDDTGHGAGFLFALAERLK